MTNEEWIAAFREYVQAYIRNGHVFPGTPAQPRERRPAVKKSAASGRSSQDGPRACMDCGRDISGMDRKRKRCPDCKRKSEAERQRMVREARPKTRPHTTCVDCGADITMLNWRAERCPECSKRHTAEMRREQYYARRKPRLCVVCGRQLTDWARKYCHSCRPPVDERQPRRCVDCGKDITMTTKAPAKRCPECRMENDRRMDSEKRARRRKAGICVTCGHRPAVEGGTTCVECRERAKKYDERRPKRADFASTPRSCVDCGADITGTAQRVRCVECSRKHVAEYQRIYERKRLDRLRGKGLCIRCGKEPATSGTPYCGECREERNRAARHRYHAAHGNAQAKPEPQARTCPDCGVAMPDGYANGYCPECIAARCRRAWEESRRKRDGS